MKEYDVVVIGSGGGTKLVKPVARLGKKVAIIEKGRLGGTCLNHGCIPSKMLIHVADVMDQIKTAEKFDIDIFGSITVDFEKIVERVNATIDKDSDSIKPFYDKDPLIDLYHGEAKFVDKKVVEVNGEKITGKKIFITVGARAAVPSIKGVENVPYQTYFEALRDTKQPKSMIVIGGGYIALELGYFYAALGTDTHFIVRSRMLKQEDAEIQEQFEKVFSSKQKVYFGITPKEVSYDKGEFTVLFSDDTVLKAEKLLIATGTKPWTDTLSLENTEVTLDAKGFVEVDEFLETKQKDVYAFGDCIGRNFFRHSANFEGEYLFNALYGKNTQSPIVYPPVPHAVFSNPQIGSVGKTEQDLQNEGADYIVGRCLYRKSAMGMALLDEEGLVKLLFVDKKLVGAHIIGVESSNMIHMLIAYINMDATLEDMLRTIYVHPALPETVRNAARDARAQYQARES